jgi:hypothetical protein
MTGATKGAVLGVWAVTLVAAFAVGRVTVPPESASAPDNLGTAIRTALGEKDGVDRAERTASLLQQLDPENVLEVAAVYDQMINILGELDIHPFAIAWARFDPAAALDHTLSWPFRDKRQIGANGAIEGWAMRDPIGALQAYEETSARLPSFSEDLFLNMLTGWVYSGEGGLDEYIAGLSNQRQEMGVTRVAGKLMRNGGAEAAMSWVNSIVRNDAYEKKFKKRAFRRGIRIVGRWDPELAATWAMEHEGQGYAVDAPRIVAGRWGSRDGRAAMQWVRDHPSEELRGLAVHEAFRTWSKSDRKGAVEWLESETLTAFHDPAIIFYAKDLSNRAPEEAIVWCERILTSDRRLRCLAPAAAKWYQRDAVAAETWLQQSPLDEEARRIVRTPPEERRQQQRSGRPMQSPKANPPGA